MLPQGMETRRKMRARCSGGERREGGTCDDEVHGGTRGSIRGTVEGGGSSGIGGWAQRVLLHSAAAATSPALHHAHACNRSDESQAPSGSTVPATGIAGAARARASQKKRLVVMEPAYSWRESDQTVPMVATK